MSMFVSTKIGNILFLKVKNLFKRCYKKNKGRKLPDDFLIKKNDDVWIQTEDDLFTYFNFQLFRNQIIFHFVESSTITEMQEKKNVEDVAPKGIITDALKHFLARMQNTKHHGVFRVVLWNVKRNKPWAKKLLQRGWKPLHDGEGSVYTEL